MAHEASMTWKELVVWVWEILGYPLFELEGHSISLGKLVSGVLLMGIGWAVSARATDEADRRVLARLNLDDSLRYTLRRLIYYFFLFLTVLMTLRLLHVPLTVFTVIGGALAVGIGFGSQNLVNNFISGLLVMAERPIRVHDYIEVDGVSGRVQNIGIRSTMVRTLANSLVIIPNTTFIEKNLTNWTLSGVIAGVVRIGVAYGTDVQKFREVCLSVAKATSGVLEAPEPSLLFVDFGDNALIFDLGVTLDAQSFPQRKAIESEIRYRLHDAFSAQGIEVPFPQRDLRLSVRDAVSVRLQN